METLRVLEGQAPRLFKPVKWHGRETIAFLTPGILSKTLSFVRYRTLQLAVRPRSCMLLMFPDFPVDDQGSPDL
jgi:hypothetical protein